jgi:adhesin transport system outer membrane protein
MLDLKRSGPRSQVCALALLCVVFGSVVMAQNPPAALGERQLLAALPAGVTPAAAPGHRVFDELLLSGLQVHPSIRSAQAQASGAKLDVEVARWAFWPTLSVSNQRATNQLGAYQNLSTLSIQQPLWSGGALTSRVAATEKLDQASLEQVAVVQADLGLRLVDIWAALLDAEANRRVTLQSLDALNRYHAIMTRRVSVGLSSEVELRLLAVRLGRARTDLADAQVSIQIAAQRMAQVVGGPVDAVLPDLLQPIAHERLAQWFAWQSDAVAFSRLGQHPAVRKAELDAAAAADQLSVQMAERLPKLVLGYQRQLADRPMFMQERNSWSLGFNFTPGAGLASRTQSEADSARLRARLEAVDTVRQEKREQLLQDWVSLKREFERRASLDAVIQSASDVLASYERQYFGGTKTWLEVLNAVQELSQSQLRLAQAGNASTLAYYRWRLRGGELPHQTNWMQ